MADIVPNLPNAVATFPTTLTTFPTASTIFPNIRIAGPIAAAIAATLIIVLSVASSSALNLSVASRTHFTASFMYGSNLSPIATAAASSADFSNVICPFRLFN